MTAELQQRAFEIARSAFGARVRIATQFFNTAIDHYKEEAQVLPLAQLVVMNALLFFMEQNIESKFQSGVDSL